jgi:hypothetical protein
MTIFGTVLLVIAFLATICMIVVDFKKREYFGLGLGIFFLVLIGFLVGIIADTEMHNSYSNNLEITTTPDTLIVTGYVLKIDTVKAGE